MNKKKCKYCCLHRQAKINLPAHKVNLSQWIAEFSDDDYRKVSKNHIAAGCSVLSDGTKCKILIERYWHHILIVAHYNIKISEKHYIKLVATTDTYIFGLIHVVISPVVWEMRIKQDGQHTSLIVGDICFGYNNAFTALLSILSRFIVRGYWNKEILPFAESIYRKFKD